MGKRAINRICPTCKENEASSYSTYCKICACERQKKWLKKNGYSPNKKRKQIVRQMIIDAKSKSCADCKIIYPWYVMDFDHVSGVKKFILAQATSKMRSIATILRFVGSNPTLTNRFINTKVTICKN